MNQIGPYYCATTISLYNEYSYSITVLHNTQPTQAAGLIHYQAGHRRRRPNMGLLFTFITSAK